MASGGRRLLSLSGVRLERRVEQIGVLRLLVVRDGLAGLHTGARQFDHSEQRQLRRAHTSADTLTHLDGARTDQHRLLLAVDPQDLGRDAAQFVLFALVDDVRVVPAAEWACWSGR